MKLEFYAKDIEIICKCGNHIDLSGFNGIGMHSNNWSSINLFKCFNCDATLALKNKKVEPNKDNGEFSFVAIDNIGDKLISDELVSCFVCGLPMHKYSDDPKENICSEECEETKKNGIPLKTYTLSNEKEGTDE